MMLHYDYKKAQRVIIIVDQGSNSGHKVQHRNFVFVAPLKNVSPKTVRKKPLQTKRSGGIAALHQTWLTPPISLCRFLTLFVENRIEL